MDLVFQNKTKKKKKNEAVHWQHLFSIQQPKALGAKEHNGLATFLEWEREKYLEQWKQRFFFLITEQ